MAARDGRQHCSRATGTTRLRVDIPLADDIDDDAKPFRLSRDAFAGYLLRMALAEHRRRHGVLDLRFLEPTHTESTEALTADDQEVQMSA